MIVKSTIGIWLSVVIVAALAFPIVQAPQAWYEFPLVPGLGENVRILFFHVPMAWVSVVAFVLALIYAVRYLVRKQPLDDLKSASSAGLGLLFCVLATLTGSLWARFSWGSFWNWDPRQTSIVALLLIYGAYFALRSALSEEGGASERRATLSAVYAVLAGVTMPFLVFVMPRMVASLHPDPIVNTQGKINMNASMLSVFLASLAGFTAFFGWMLNLKVRAARVIRFVTIERHRN